MSEKPLKKVDKRLYLEPYNDGKDFKWIKELRSLWIDLKEVKLIYACSVDRLEFPFGEEYKEKEEHYIIAKGELQNRTIRLIMKDGTQQGYFDVVEIILKPRDKDQNQEVHGYLMHFGGEMLEWENRKDPYVCLELYPPREVLANARTELSERENKKVTLSVYVDVFQSEVENSLAEPSAIPGHPVDRVELKG